MKLKDLNPNPDNPRKFSKEKLDYLKKSVEKFGPLDGFIKNNRFDRLVGAHQRLTVLPKDSEIIITHKFPEKTKTGTIAIGYVDIYGERHPYREIDVDEDTERAMNLAANSHRGEWLEDKATEWLLDLNDKGWDSQLLGWDSKKEESESESKSDKEIQDVEQFIIAITCKDEIDMQKMFQEISDRGYECKLIM